MLAKDVMTENVISVSEDSPIHEVVGLLLKYRISGVPVVDGGRKVVGMISEGDLLRPEAASRAPTRRPWWLQAVSAGQTVSYEKAHGRTAGAVMTRNVITVDEDTPVNEIAGLLEQHHIKRVPALRDGRLVGIVSRANLLHGLANTPCQCAPRSLAFGVFPLWTMARRNSPRASGIVRRFATLIPDRRPEAISAQIQTHRAHTPRAQSVAAAASDWHRTVARRRAPP